MERNWKQWLAAFLMGVMLPGLIFRIATGLSQGSHLQQNSQQTQVTTAPDWPQNLPMAQNIPVLHGKKVEILDLDTYLVGVLLAEMPASFGIEALKAQAVAARTCALEFMQDPNKHPVLAVCTDSTCCQAYITPEEYRQQGGAAENIDKIQKAVADTAGQVLTYQGQLIEATYFSCSGGRTEDAVAVWGAEVPYLQSVESPGEEWASIYSQSVTFTSAEFANALGRKLYGSPETWLGQVRYTRGGGVDTMVVAGKSYSGVQLRQLLSLNSTAFTMKAEGNTITVTTSGRGHRVGMSQYGAEAMAATGSTYEQILQYYYKGVRIDKLGAVE